MKRVFAGLCAAALLGGAGGSAQAQTGSHTLTIGVTVDLSYFASCFGLGSGPGPGGCGSPNGGCGRGRVCLPPPGWSPEYPKPMMYGGMSASPPCQGGYSAPYGGYGYAPYGGYGYAPSPMVYGWKPPAATAASKISTVPPPEPATGSPK